ncbi:MULTISPECIES: BGTF surface domain-containing protein [Halobacterium]|uniref:BGTF surface domain-containing protein n=1 Tax=Halobacterium TaxID=2239 RepID=UPI000A4A26CD|nr:MULTISPECIES: BGTF surface domain-containing protein [Halobacterium]MCG1004926.1 cell surface protein [Halobacterium noricense]
MNANLASRIPWTGILIVLLFVPACAPAMGGSTAMVGHDPPTADTVPNETLPAATTNSTLSTAPAIYPAPDSHQLLQAETAQSSGWTQHNYTQAAGDLVTVTLNLSNTSTTTTEATYIQLGSAASGFVDILHVTDADGDGNVTFSINTRAVGTSTSLGPFRSELVYHSETDTVRSAVHGRLNTATDGPTFYAEDGTKLAGFEEYLAALDLIDSAATARGTDQLRRPIDVGTYPIVASATGTFHVQDAPESAETDTAPAQHTRVDRVVDRATIRLTQPAIEDVAIHTAPAATANSAENVTALQTALSARETTTTTDRLVVAVNATGLSGHLVALEESFDSLTTGIPPQSFAQLEARTGEGVEFAITAETGPVTQGPGSSGGVSSPLEVVNFATATPSEATIYADTTTDTLYVVIDTRAFDNLQPTGAGAEDFSAELQYNTDADTPFLFDREDRHIQTYYRGFVGGAGGDPTQAAFPYLSPGEYATAEANISITTPRARFESSDRNSTATGLLLPHTGNVTIHGTTNLAPGTDATLQLASVNESRSPGFIYRTPTTVTANGTFSGTLDLSSVPAGERVALSLLVDSHSVASTTATLTPNATQSTISSQEEPTGASTSATTAPPTGSSGGGVPNLTPATTLLIVVVTMSAVLVHESRQ